MIMRLAFPRRKGVPRRNALRLRWRNEEGAPFCFGQGVLQCEEPAEWLGGAESFDGAMFRALRKTQRVRIETDDLDGVAFGLGLRWQPDYREAGIYPLVGPPARLLQQYVVPLGDWLDFTDLRPSSASDAAPDPGSMIMWLVFPRGRGVRQRKPQRLRWMDVSAALCFGEGRLVCEEPDERLGVPECFSGTEFRMRHQVDDVWIETDDIFGVTFGLGLPWSLDYRAMGICPLTDPSRGDNRQPCFPSSWYIPPPP